MHTILETAGRFDAGFFRGQIVELVVRGFAMLLLWQGRATQRHALARLDDRLLRDVGLSQSEVTRELRKPFWRR